MLGLKSKGRLNESKGGARTYVVCEGERGGRLLQPRGRLGGKAQGFLASGQKHARADSRDSLGQLAVDSNYQGRGLGGDLIVDAGEEP